MYYKKIKIPFFHYTQNQLQMDQIPNFRTETIKSYKNSIVEILHNFSLGYHF